MWCCVFFFANRIGTAASSGDKVQISQHTQYIVRVPFFVAGAVFGEVPSRMECHALESVFFAFHISAATRGAMLRWPSIYVAGAIFGEVACKG